MQVTVWPMGPSGAAEQAGGRLLLAHYWLSSQAPTWSTSRIRHHDACMVSRNIGCLASMICFATTSSRNWQFLRLTLGSDIICIHFLIFVSFTLCTLVLKLP
eukprot:TRINITY_DN23262_c0_g2_i2.p3 TRINITY_DN23262_c0_g2~~TRINITY_DN23262_c0_g2_i2.p3  ORF type:complete len:102 (+),score=7.36 TRINITY_DN23262_c0_g2_i2:220-525(+)